MGVTNFSNKKYMSDVCLRVCLFPSQTVPSTIIFATIKIASKCGLPLKKLGQGPLESVVVDEVDTVLVWDEQ